MIVIIDYGMGNVASVKKALLKVGAKGVEISRNPDVLEKANGLVLPGVGAFGDGMKNLRSYGLSEVLDSLVLKKKLPLFGICLGMQLLAEKGTEFGDHEGLGFIKGSVVKLEVNNERLPHVGWNDVEMVKDSEYFKGVESQAYYFVHSFHLACKDSEDIVGICQYGKSKFAAVIERDNIFATQFHPEKSQSSGLKILENFVTKCQYA